MKKIIFALILLPALAPASETSLKDFLEQAWKQSPQTEMARLQERESREFADAGRARYLPHLSVEAIDSTGFPGSTSSLHVGGLMGSSYRKGLGAGILWDQLLYDFGRTGSLLKKYAADKDLAAAQLEKEKFEFVSQLSQAYLECARNRSQLQTDRHLGELGSLIAKETRKMTDTGQKTIIDEDLTRIDVEDIQREESELNGFAAMSSRELGLYLNQDRIECQNLEKIDRTVGAYSNFHVKPPQVLLAQALRQSEEAQADQAAAEQRPWLTATGSYGYLQDERLVDQKDYALGVGLIFPFFNGGEDSHKEAAYRLRLQAREKEVDLARLEFRIHMDKLNLKIKYLRETLHSLERQSAEAEKTMKLALKRYLTLEGTLIDVRESFKHLRSVEQERLRAAQDLISSRLQRDILDTDGA
jgi:outer membrane protein TolC